MEKEKETSLVIKNDSFFDRLKAFLKMFFSYFNTSEEEKNKNQTETQINNVVKNNMKSLENINNENFTEEEYEKKLQEIIIELQEAYEKGIIKEEDLTFNQKEDLKKLYVLQINSLKKAIENNESVILKLKEKIDIINNNQK